MATLPSANVTIDATAGAKAAGDAGYLFMMAAVAQNADMTPRVFSSVGALLSQHGYSPGASLAAMVIEATRKPVLFAGLPIVTAGTIGAQNSTGVTGSSAITVSAAAGGVLEEIDGIFKVVTGGTIGTDAILADFSADGGRTYKRIRIRTSSYTPPYLGITLNFGAGTLAAGDTYTFRTTAPIWDAAGLTAARTALAAQQKKVRTMFPVGDCANSTIASAVVTEVNAYETANQRFTKARASIVDRTPLATAAKVTKRMSGNPNLTFAEVGASGDTITRDAGSFIAEGFAIGDTITVSGSASNNVTGAITGVSALVLTMGTTDLTPEGPVSNVTITGSPTMTFAEVGATGDTITRSSGSWTDDGFRVGDTVTIAGTVSNNVTGPIANLTATVLTFGTTDLAAEAIRADAITITKGQTMAAYVSAQDAAFASIDAKKRISLGLGRARKQCPLTGWWFRRSVHWAAIIREFSRDVQFATWEKEQGPLDGWDLTDGNGKVVEYDERTVGGALAARFTCFRTWANGPEGAFIAQDLTRDDDGEILSLTHNLDVANVACTTIQAQTENIIGKVLKLKTDGTGHATEESLRFLESKVNKALARELLASNKNGGDPPRASGAVWQASRTDDLSGAEATMSGVLSLNLNGTVTHVNTVVRVT